ncbi:MAG: hypothetical protein VB118_09090 [Oscillospiraceae bacterium]|nr:hypothetical protein [Oscillospiraceae bacterium]
MRTSKRVICAALAVITILMCSLVSCSETNSTLISFKDMKLSTNVFLFLVSRYKTTYLQYAYQTMTGKTVAISDLTDYPDFWAQQVGDTAAETRGAGILQMTLYDQEAILYYAWYAKDKGISLTSAEKASLKETLDSSITSVYKTKSAFEAALKEFGMTYNLYLGYLELSKLSEKGKSSLYEAGGEAEINDAKILDYFKNNYYTTNRIKINVKTDADGKELSEEDAAKKTALVDEIMKKMEDGTLFEDLLEYDETSPDTDKASAYKDAHRTESLSEIGASAYFDTVKSLGIGGIGKAEIGSNIFIIKRYALDEAKVTDYTSTIKGMLMTKDFATRYSALSQLFVVDKSVFDLLNVSNIPLNKMFG